MPVQSGGPAGSSSRGARGTEDWSDSSSLSPSPTSTPLVAPTSSIGEADTDPRKNFIDSVADRARSNLRNSAGDDANSSNISLHAPANVQVDNNASGVIAHGREKTDFQYPEPKPQRLPSATSPSTAPIVQRRIDIYTSFGSAANFVNQQIPKENPQHFDIGSTLHTHYIIKKVSTVQCDECRAKGKGEEIYKCSACVKQICQSCVEQRLNREQAAQQAARERKAKGLAETDEDDYKWRWQGEYRHEGLKLCYKAREAAGAKGDFEIDVPSSLLSPLAVGDRTVTVFMTLNNEGDGNGKKRLRADNDIESASGGGSPPRRHLRKKARKEEIPRSDPRDPPTTTQILRRNVHGKKALQQLRTIDAAYLADDSPSPELKDEGRALSRPPPLDLHAAQPSPTLPQVRRLYSQDLPFLSQDNILLSQRRPSPYLPSGQSDPLRDGILPPRQGGVSLQPPHQIMWAPGHPPQHLQYPPQPTGLYGHPAFSYSQPPVHQQIQFNAHHGGHAVRQKGLQHYPRPNSLQVNPQWGPRPPPPPEDAIVTAPQPASNIAPASMWAPPAGTLMQVQMGDSIRSMTWNEYQAYMQVRHQRPSTEPSFEPPNLIRRGNNETTHRIPWSTNGRPEHTAIYHGREVAFLPFTHPYPVQTIAAPWHMGIVHYEQSHSMDEVLNVVNERWRRERQINRTVSEVELIDPIVIDDEDESASAIENVQLMRPEVFDSMKLPEHHTAMTEARDEEIQQEDPAEEAEPRSDRPSSAPLHDFHPPRRFPTPPSLRKPPPVVPIPWANTDWLPSSPPVRTELGVPHELPSTTRNPTADADVVMNDTHIINSNASEAETVLLSPSSLHRRSEEPSLPPLRPLSEPPSTPLRQIASNNFPSTAGSRYCLAVTPNLPAYHNAHHFPNRAEHAINGERLEAHRRAVVRAMLHQVPEAHALGLMGDRSPSMMPVSHRPWLSPSREQVQAMMSSPPTGCYGPGGEVMRRRHGPDDAEDMLSRNESGGRVGLAEGHQLRPGGTHGITCGGQQDVMLSSVRVDGDKEKSLTARNRAGAIGFGDEDDVMEIDPTPGLPAGSINQDEVLNDVEDVDSGKDEINKGVQVSTTHHRPLTQDNGARVKLNSQKRTTITNSHIRQQSATPVHGRMATCAPASPSTTSGNRVGSVAQAGNADSDQDGSEDDLQSAIDEGEPIPTIPPTPTRRTRSGKEYTGEGTGTVMVTGDRGWGVSKLLGDKRGRG